MDYPQEILIELEGEPDFAGRITLNRLCDSFNVEIDIINLESRKIFHHVGMLYRISDHDEAVKYGVQQLSNFLKKSL